MLKDCRLVTRMSERIAAMKRSRKENAAHEKHVFERVDAVQITQKTKDREFGGAIGTFLLLFFLPLTLYFLNLVCSKESCSTTNIPEFPAHWRAFCDLEATIIFLGWFGFQAILYMLPVGRVVLGHPTVVGNHGRLSYRCNGFFAYVVSFLALVAALYYKVPVMIVYDKFIPLMTSAIIFSFILSALLYIKARLGSESQKASAGNTGNIIYDFFMGHELNPGIGNFDFKFFCEMRPGLIGWIMLDMIFLVKQYHERGEMNLSLAFVVISQALYVADGLWFEDSILTMMDTMYEGFGFMLCFGDLAWVPFLFSVQGRYVLEHPNPLPWYCLVGIIILNGIGYYIFRGSNSQKNEFMKNPHSPAFAHLETIPTETGQPLLVSGWWGLCRKPNYLGDLIMALSWSLPCGFHSIWPYFYPIQFLILLIHRERRDSIICQERYGSAWTKYCEKVKYRIIPKVY